MYNEIDLDKIDIAAEPPAEEPDRQYYFMAKCKAKVRDFEQEHGHRPKACVVNMGCQMNARDSEKLTGILEMIGYEQTDSEEADFVIYNTCTVRENANNKVWGRLGYLNNYKKQNTLISFPQAYIKVFHRCTIYKILKVSRETYEILC